MTNLNEIILRIKADTSNFDNPKDIIRDELPQFWRGNNLKFEIGVFDGDNLLSVSSYASITVAIRKMLDNGEIPSASHQALMQKSTYDLNDALTIETWENGSSQHASIQFSAEESNILSGNHWLSIWASTSDAATKYITLCAGIIRVSEDGGGISSQPPEPLVVYYTARECDDTFVNKDNVDPSVILGTSDEKIATQNAVKTYVDSIASEKASTASNLGSGEGVFSSKSGANLQFKSLKAGSNVTISSDSSEITIAASGGSGGMSNPMTTSGDLIVGGTSGTPTRLGVGSAGKYLKVGSSGNSIEWGDGSSYTLQPATSNTLGGIKVGSNLSVTQDGTLSADAGQYELPVASTNTLGGIKVGERLSVTSSGVLSANDQSYTLPPATSNILGGIKVGSNLSVTQDGILSADDQSYMLPIASASTLGGIKVGERLSVTSSGVLSANDQSYTLPPATSNTLGGIKVGSNLSITQDGTLSADAGQYELPVASTNTLGGIKVGERLSVTSGGVLSANDQSYTLPPATSNTLGGIKVGNNLSVTQDGTLSADDQSYTLPIASASTLGGVKPDGSTITINSESGIISSTGEANTASNLGSGEGVFSSKSGVNLQFKSLKAGNNVTISSDSSEITIAATGGGSGGMSNPMTTSGDLIVGGTSGTPTRLGIGSAGKFLKVGSSGNSIEWGDGSSYTLQPATSNTLGGIKVGSNLSVTQDGTLSADAGQYELPVASSNTLGGIKIGEGLSVTSGGVLSANDQSYTLPIASASTLGGVKPDGSTITINSESGVISSTGEANTASNLGSGEGIFSSKSDANLQFKSLKAGSNVTISSDSSEITIASTGGGGGGMSNPMTTSGDLIVGGASGTPMRLGVGSAGKYLKVGSSGNDLEWGDGSSYTLPPATSNTLGGIKVGNNLSVTQDGTLSADAGQYELPVASSNTLGGIKIGERLSITSGGVLSANDQSYTLPPATSNTLGGIKVGNNLSVTQDGTLSADAGQYELPIASANTLGGIKIGERLSITSGGVLSANDQSYTLPPATSNTLGGIKVGNNLSVTQDGTLSADDQSYTLPVASASTLGGVKPDGSTITINSENGVISSTGEANTASNLGSGEGVFSSKSGVNLQFKSLKAGSNVTISSDSSEITIAASGGGGGGGMSNPMTTSGDLIVGGTSGTPTRLGVGSAGKYLKVGSSGNSIEWGDGSSYTLPPATSNTLGGIKVGNNLSVTQDGTLSADAGQYELPVASSNTLGGIKVGERLSVTSGGVLSASDQSYTLPPATSNTLGGIKVGNNLSVTQDGTLSADDQSYTLPIASASTLGGVKPDGSTITINSESGVISSTGEANTASNLGSGEGVFSSKSGATLQLKSLKAGSNVTISSDSSEITISSTGGGGGGMSNPMTTSGDLIVGGTSGTPTRLGVGSAEQALVVNTNCDGVMWKDVLSCTSKSLSSNGYFTFSDGLILQWGYLAFAGTNRKESTITLPVSFSSKNYSFSGLIKSNVSGTDKHSLCLSENARSSSTLTVCIYGADSSTTFNGITWIAVGY